MERCLFSLSDIRRAAAKLLVMALCCLSINLATIQKAQATGDAGGGGAGDDTELRTEWVGFLMAMTGQFTTLMMQQAQIIGSFFDAKHQLETQRLFQQKVAEAHKDYQPSEDLCYIGTFSRDLADAQRRTLLTRNAVAQAIIARELASGQAKTYDETMGTDIYTRRQAFLDVFCNIVDNAYNFDLPCDYESGEPEQQNADINYTQTIDLPLTIDVDFLDEDITMEEENIFAFLDQIFMNLPFPPIVNRKTVTHGFIRPYLELRSLVAMRSVAQNSFAHIIAEKTIGPTGDTAITPYIFSLLEEMGMSEEIMLDYLGEHPSYYAIMEVLTKKIFQHPDFFASLYDKPANVKRMKTALTAIKLMQERDIHDAMLRREMLSSMILEARLRTKQDDLSTNQIKNILADNPEAATIPMP